MERTYHWIHDQLAMAGRIRTEKIAAKVA
jgi:hypothetical protein